MFFRCEYLFLCTSCSRRIDGHTECKATCERAVSRQPSRSGESEADATSPRYPPFHFSHAHRRGGRSRDPPPHLLNSPYSPPCCSCLRAWAALSHAATRASVLVAITRRRIGFAACKRVWGALVNRTSTKICLRRLVARKNLKR